MPKPMSSKREGEGIMLPAARSPAMPTGYQSSSSTGLR
jgi:hypothetical protein